MTKDEAIKLASLAASKGYVPALYDRAQIGETGWGVTVDGNGFSFRIWDVNALAELDDCVARVRETT